jgi:hypothetical protein
MKADFKQETGHDADKDISLYVSYLQAKALLAINQNIGFMSAAVQEIKGHVQQIAFKLK